VRRGRISKSQRNAIETLSKKYVISYTSELVPWHSYFGRVAPLVLEIGSGMGEVTIQIATEQPDTDFIACEVHTPGIGTLLQNIEATQLRNIRLIQKDVNMVLQHMISNESLVGIHIFFPDPWPKRKHHKRRLIQSDFLKLAVSKIQLGGYLHIATDWEDYALQILQALRQQTLLTNTSPDPHGFIDKPSYRPDTKFEKRGIKLGHKVWDIVFRKVS
jgi:tRNA (guanine-N7-)-methyltransferase